MGFTKGGEKPFQEISVKMSADCFVLQMMLYSTLQTDSRSEQIMEFSVGYFFFFFPDTSGVVFDTRSKMVMSQGGTAERMKEKVGNENVSAPDRTNEPAGILVNGCI